jgi:hypothetical protein
VPMLPEPMIAQRILVMCCHSRESGNPEVGACATGFPLARE